MPFPAATPVTRRSLRRRRKRLALAALAGVPVSSFAVGVPAMASGLVPPVDPAGSIQPPAEMVQDCYEGQGSAAACQQAALEAIDVARADEGVGPLLLPDNYEALSPPEQLLVVVDLERVDRGLVPVDALDPALDAAAQAGAAGGRDPLGPSGYTWFSTWAGGEPDALTADYDWLYDDGPDSPNVTCPPGCWGHRNAVLAPLAAPSMGAGWSGTEWTVLIVNGWPASGGFSWVSELSDLRPAIPGQLSASAGPGSTSEVVVPVTASGAPVEAAGMLTSGSGYRVVVPSCRATAGSTCDLVVDFTPTSVGSWPAVLSVSAPGGPYTVRISGFSGHGYWEAAANGAIYGFGGTGWLGDLSHTRLTAPIVGMAATPDRRGYWLVAADGGVFSFGDARFYGSTGAVHLRAPIVGMAPSGDGGGYWLVAADGGVFSFGDAAFHGSTGAVRLQRPVVGISATHDGGGYWLVASDGGIFSFGDATFHGSTGGVALDAPVVGMSMTTTGGGYWLAASDGGVFSFGDAAFHGSTGGDRLVAPVVGITTDPTGGGYWETASDGGQFPFGAPFLGSAAAEQPDAQVIGASAS